MSSQETNDTPTSAAAASSPDDELASIKNQRAEISDQLYGKRQRKTRAKARFALAKQDEQLRKRETEIKRRLSNASPVSKLMIAEDEAAAAAVGNDDDYDGDGDGDLLVGEMFAEKESMAPGNAKNNNLLTPPKHMLTPPKPPTLLPSFHPPSGAAHHASTPSVIFAPPNSTSPNSKPPSRPPARPPSSHHGSTPSVVFASSRASLFISNKPNPITTSSAHNRNVTPHTETLMSLFAKPASTPLTPANDHYGATDDNKLNMEGGGPPLMPGFFDPPSRGNGKVVLPKTPTRSNGSARKAPKTIKTAGTRDRGDLPSLPQPSVLEREITPIAQNHKANDDGANRSFRRQKTPTSHNRDDTVVAHNLGRKVQCYVEDNEQQPDMYMVGNGVSWDAADESTGLIHSNVDAKLPDSIGHIDKLKELISANLQLCDADNLKPTLIGAFLFSLYQLVFCFAEASAISRPSHSGTSSATSLLSPMAMMACMGSLVSAPMLIAVLGGDYPALYPCLDMFLAPFLGGMAA